MTRRTLRINGLIRQELSELLQREVKDPRLKRLVSVTEVTTSPDLRHAKVFVSTMGSEEEKKEVLEGLSSASGFLHHELRERLSLRHVPELFFTRDDSIERGAHLLQLIDRVVERDREKPEID